MIDQEGGQPLAPIIGQDRKATMSQAALVNGYMGHALDFDDVHSDVRGHPSTVILPTLLSLSGNGQVTGRRFLQAYIVGVEIMARLGQAIGNSHYLRGWHNTSTLGVIAAAACWRFFKGIFTGSVSSNAWICCDSSKWTSKSIWNRNQTTACRLSCKISIACHSINDKWL